MGKRYVFWAKPDGKPSAEKRGKCAPTVLLRQIGKVATVKDDKLVVPEIRMFPRYQTAIRSAIVVQGPDGEFLNDIDSWAIVLQAIKSILRKQDAGHPICPSRLIDEADREAGKYYRRKTQYYVLVSSLSVKSFPCKSLSIGGCEIRPIVSRGTRYPFPEALKCQIALGAFGKYSESQYQLMRVRTRGRTTHEAANKALTSLNLLCGLWNLFTTYGSWSYTAGVPKRKPLGVVLTGPVHTIHSPVAGNVQETYWYDPDFSGYQQVFKPKQGWSTIEGHRRWAVNRIARLPFAKDLNELLVRYAIALEQTNMDVAFLHMWSILEKITCTVGAKYDDTIRRAIWVFSDRDIAGELLETLRLRRNQYVHSARPAEGRDQIAYMIKSFVDPHLLRLLRNDFKVESLQEYAEYLSLPTSTERIKKRRQQLTQALRIMKK